METFHVLHICDYAAAYRGNFIESLESLETYHSNVKNFYLFPSRAKGTAATKWIDELNNDRKRAYYQESNFFQNFILLSKILKKHKINRIVRHFSDPKIDILIKLLFKGEHVIRFFHCSCPIIKNPAKRVFTEFVWHKNKLVGVSDAIAREIQQAHPKFSSHSIVNAILFDRLNVLENFEKAEGSINGAYPMVCREFVRLLMAKHPELEYINREDDMGFETLRRSKQSYKPEYMLKKYTARWIYG